MYACCLVWFLESKEMFVRKISEWHALPSIASVHLWSMWYVWQKRFVGFFNMSFQYTGILNDIVLTLFFKSAIL